jgi:hypothetical protein
MPRIFFSHSIWLFFGLLKRHLTTEVNRFTRTGISSITKAEWLLTYYRARQVAVRPSNIATGFRRAGLIHFQPSSVIRRLPTPPTTPTKDA